jgi:hypothetical protein
MKLSNAILKISIILLGLVLLHLSPTCAYAKYLVYAEYFFDTDPGQGNGTKITAPCDGSFNEAEEDFCINNIPVGVLSDGRHTFFLRLKDSENKWGMRRLDFYVVSSSPYVSKILTGAEYYFDSDPGQGSGLPLPAADGAFDEPIEFLLAQGIESSPLSLGSHSLFVRVKDNYNVWSIPRKVNFNVIQANTYKILVAAEYFIDSDPGVGLGIPLTATDGAFDESNEDAFKNNISTAFLSPGSHLVGVRFKDNWSYFTAIFNGWGPKKIDTLCVCQRCSLFAPPNGSKGSANRTFKWSHLDSAVSYQLQIDTGQTFNNPIRNLTVSKDTSYVTGLPNGRTLWWRVRGNYSCGAGVWSDTFTYTDVRDGTEEAALPTSFFLSHNYPNPFNPETQIDYALPRNCNVNLTIYNILGQKLKTLVDELQKAGFKTVHWDGKDDQGEEVASGIYFYRLKAGDYFETKKMVLLR